MKKNRIKYFEKDDVFFVVPNPNLSDLTDFIISFNKDNLIEYGDIVIDLKIFIGNRSDSFVKIHIEDFKLQVETITPTSNIEEYETFILTEYSKLDNNEIQKIYPVQFRNKVYETIKTH